MDTLLDRFCRYVRIDTTAVEETDQYPSSPGQLELGRLLADELRALKLQDVSVSEFGVVMGTIPGNVDGAPTIAWLAHMDTSPEARGRNVRPVVHESYDGQDIHLTGDPSKIIRVADVPALAKMKGKTLITSDGTTLLGADDKAGVAAIMTAADYLMNHSDVAHGPIRVLFTPDEEVGRGADKLNVAEIDAVCAYTLDGEGAGGIENETFSADVAVVTITGVNIHPGLAFGKMVNAIRLAAEFVERLPAGLAPETTKGRDGFVHPYVIEGGVPAVKLRIILRSFVTAELESHARVLQDAAGAVRKAHPAARVDVEIKKQYRNMLEYLDREPRAVKLATEAYRKLGIEPRFESVRGGTDGSRLSEMGMPTPNLSAGMHNYHSPLEFACLEEMESASLVLVELARLWGAEKQ
ncbi:MAG: peptidase T [Phycisphaerae bacterium]|nr:peptidase T [Phycisphaerae bacterium]